MRRITGAPRRETNWYSGGWSVYVTTYNCLPPASRISFQRNLCILPPPTDSKLVIDRCVNRRHHCLFPIAQRAVKLNATKYTERLQCTGHRVNGPVLLLNKLNFIQKLVTCIIIAAYRLIFAT